MLILSLDSAGAGCGVTVWRNGSILAEKTEKMERGQDQRLVPLILEVMQEAGVAFNDLDRIAVTRGPGSFTGLRIGLAAARGIGLAAAKPVIGIDRFSIFREQVGGPERNLLVVISSKRKELYCRFYPSGEPSAEATMMTADEVRDFLVKMPDTIVTGDFAATSPHLISPSRGEEYSLSHGKHSSPPLEDLTQSVKAEGWVEGGGVTSINYRKPTEAETTTAAILAAQSNINDPAFLPRPLYIRAPDVTMKKRPLLIQPVSPLQAQNLTPIHAASFGRAAWSPKQMQGSLALETTRGWMALENGQAVGFILYQAIPEQAEILTLAVHPKSRRRGIGEKLLKKVIESQYTRIMLEVAADNIAACHLYEKLGFRKSGTRPNYYRREESHVDAVLYDRIPGEHKLPKAL